LFLQHFRGNLDNWDCLLVDGIAGEREVILLDNSGVGLSTGTLSTTVIEMASDAIAFLDAIVVERVDPSHRGDRSVPGRRLTEATVECPRPSAFGTARVHARAGTGAKHPRLSDPDGMTNIPNQATDGVPTYLRRGDPAGRFADYHPAWVGKMASDVTLEGSILDGAVQGADAVLAVIGGARQLYDRQDFNFVGPWGDKSFIEDYTAEVR
jgi:pimeloyl-ACP methyl ester carboxylesterase